MQLSGNLSDSVRKLQHNVLSRVTFFGVETQASYKKFTGKFMLKHSEQMHIYQFKTSYDSEELSPVTDQLFSFVDVQDPTFQQTLYPDLCHWA